MLDYFNWFLFEVYYFICFERILFFSDIVFDVVCKWILKGLSYSIVDMG